MADLVPSDLPIGRQALERIIRRAAELQAAERDIGDSLTEDQVLELGRDVGIPSRYLQQALFEERSRAVVEGDRPLAEALLGPTRVAAQRTVPGNRTDLETRLFRWMTEAELLTIKRRYPDRNSWEPRRDMVASLKRSLGFAGRRYALTRAREVVGQVRQLEPGWSHVTLLADLQNTRNERLAGASVITAGGAAFTGLAIVLGIALPVAVVPAAAGLAAGLAIARGRRGGVERTQVALEQVLDRMEHGELDPASAAGASPPGVLARRLASEIRRNLGP